jgi:hypothetical protein
MQKLSIFAYLFLNLAAGLSAFEKQQILVAACREEATTCMLPSTKNQKRAAGLACMQKLDALLVSSKCQQALNATAELVVAIPSIPICCKAFSPQCLACTRGVSVEQFCAKPEWSNSIPGCPEKKPTNCLQCVTSGRSWQIGLHDARGL